MVLYKLTIYSDFEDWWRALCAQAIMVGAEAGLYNRDGAGFPHYRFAHLTEKQWHAAENKVRGLILLHVDWFLSRELSVDMLAWRMIEKLRHMLTVKFPEARRAADRAQRDQAAFRARLHQRSTALAALRGLRAARGESVRSYTDRAWRVHAQLKAAGFGQEIAEELWRIQYYDGLPEALQSYGYVIQTGGKLTVQEAALELERIERMKADKRASAAAAEERRRNGAGRRRRNGNNGRGPRGPAAEAETA